MLKGTGMRKKQKKRDDTDLIMCRNHKWAPWHIVCRHLYERRLKADQWVRMDLAPDDKRSVDADWLCVECDRRVAAAAGSRRVFDEMLKDGTLKAACCYCIADLKKAAGFLQRDNGFLEQPVPNPPYGPGGPRFVVVSDPGVPGPVVTGHQGPVSLDGYWFLNHPVSGPVVHLIHGSEDKFLPVFKTREAAVRHEQLLQASKFLSVKAVPHQVGHGKGDLFVLAMHQIGVRVMMDPVVHSPTSTSWNEPQVEGDEQSGFRVAGYKPSPN